MALPSRYAARAASRAPTSLPFGWGAITVILVGAIFTIVGIVIILYAFFGFILGTIGAATSSSFSVMSFFQSFFGAIILFVIGGVLAGIGGWLVRLWWIFLLLGAVTGSAANTAQGREAARTSEVRVRCQSCGRLNPEFVKFCMSCGKPV
jgi:zinc-ribbon domain